MKVKLRVVDGPHKGSVFEFDRHDTFIVGRSPTAHFRLPRDDEFFSRNHFLIEVNPPSCRILDLNSRNGTYVNNKRISTADLMDQDLIRGGKTRIKVTIERDVTETHETSVFTPELETGDESAFAPHLQQADHVVASEPIVAIRGNSKVDSAASSSSATTALMPQFPGYRTIALIGKGGMGSVYEAVSDADCSRVAIKVVSPSAAATPKELSLFIREASILKDLAHPNIVRFRDFNQNHGGLFIVMDYIAGSTASQIVKLSGQPMVVERAVKLIAQLLEALSYAHGRGYVHRDVKPSNLLISTANGKENVYLADFGLARAFQSSKLSGLTMTGDIGGTTPFMSPEQITNYRQANPAADQYASAATLYYLLTKQRVYDLPNGVAKQILMILQDPPVPITSRRADLPATLVNVMHRALSRDPAARFPDVKAFQKELLASLTDRV